MRYQQGLTSIELLIVVLIAAILVAITYPSCQNYIHQTRLTSVRTQTLHNAQQFERYYTQESTFVGFPDGSLQQSQYFSISFSEGADSMPSPSDPGYILKAVSNKETSADETCAVYHNDSDIIWANSGKQDCPGYEIPKSEQIEI